VHQTRTGLPRGHGMDESFDRSTGLDTEAYIGATS